MSLYYPMIKYTTEEFEILAEMWLEDFENISADVFVEACKLHRKASQFMPTGKDILDRCADVWEARKRNIKQLPEPVQDLSPEQIKENIAKIREVMSTKGPAKTIVRDPEKDLKETVKAKLEEYKQNE